MNRHELVNWMRQNNIKSFRLCKNAKNPATKNGVKDAALITDSAHFNDFNIGIAAGNGFVVVDVDPRNDGLLTLANWKSAGFTLPRTVTVRTPQGGTHHYYKGHLSNTKFQGIDIISNGKYVVAPTSTFKNIEYHFDEDEVTEFANVPDWLIELCKRDILEFQKRIETDCVDLSDIEKLLTYISPDIGYEDWVKVGMAIHSADEHDKGFTLYSRWSQGLLHGKPAEKFCGEKELLKKWKTFKRDGGITVGTIYHLAEEGIRRDAESYFDFSAPVEVKECKKEITNEPKPQPNTDNSLPIPKVGLLADLYNEFLEHAFEPIPVFALGSAIAVMSAITQRAYLVGTDTRTRSYNLLLGQAGVGKNDYLTITKQLLHKAIPGGQLIGDEVRSDQAMKAVLHEYPNRIFLIDEWTDFLERAYGPKPDAIAKAIASILKTLWGDVKELEGSRKRNKDESLNVTKEPRLSILATGVPSKLLTLMQSEDFIRGGLLSRIEIWSFLGRPKFQMRDHHTYDASPALGNAIMATHHEHVPNVGNPADNFKDIQSPRAAKVPFCKESAEKIAKEYDSYNLKLIDEEEYSIIRRQLERMQMYAGVHAISRKSKIIEVEDLEFAIPLAHYQLEHTRLLMGKVAQKEHTDELGLILRHIPFEGFISKRDLWIKSKTFRKIAPKSPDQVEYLNYLVANGYIKTDGSKFTRLR